MSKAAASTGIDPVAVYAAAVATATFFWQVLRWRADRRGKLELSLFVGLMIWPGVTDDPHVRGAIYNKNDYPVRLASIGICIVPWWSYWLRIYRLVEFSPEEAGAPNEIPGHDSVKFYRLITESVYRDLSPECLKPGNFVVVRAKNSLGRNCTAATRIRRPRGFRRAKATSAYLDSAESQVDTPEEQSPGTA